MNTMNTLVDETYTEGDVFRPLLLCDPLNTVATTRDALRQIDRSRDDIHEVRNLLRSEDERLAAVHNREYPVSMQEDELQKANAAALKAAEDVVKAQAVLHRNVMTLLGYRTLHEVTHP